MSEAHSRTGAWLAIRSTEELPSEVVDEMGEIADQIGFMPNIARLLAVTPSHFTGWWRYFDELMRGPSGLSKTQREMIAVVVSADGDCPYCEVAHAAALRLRTKDPILVDRLAVNYRHVDLNPADRVMLDFAVKLTRTPDECGQDDIDRLREAGFEDADILHLVEVTALFNYNVRLASATGLLPNPEYHELGRARRP
ncbi:MAG TPA: peroxidase-related enzyme [Acidimicrobiia bacterium]|nr:peroxidase-related enzyme [Acidimicrobiia bacterium]